MPLTPYEEFAAEPLAFPIGGKVYTVPPMGMREGLLLQRVINGDDHSLDDAPAEDGWRLVLGSAWDEMVADNVPMAAMARAGLCAMADFQHGRDVAEATWKAGVDPEALAAALTAAAQRKTAPASTGSPSTAVASTTKRRASSSGTTSRKATAPTAKRARSSRS